MSGGWLQSCRNFSSFIIFVFILRWTQILPIISLLGSSYQIPIIIVTKSQIHFSRFVLFVLFFFPVFFLKKSLFFVHIRLYLGTCSFVKKKGDLFYVFIVCVRVILLDLFSYLGFYISCFSQKELIGAWGRGKCTNL